MGFWSAYRASLKPLEVEEPIDVFLHRPLAFLLARALYRTPVSPDVITLCSIFAGIGSAICVLDPFPRHDLAAGLLLFTSIVLDCADGQLARMRKTSSVFGRMLDGVADLITAGTAAPAAVFELWRRFSSPAWQGLLVVALCSVAMVTTSFHTTMYDHYKNVFLRLTGQFKEGEDYEAAYERYHRTARSELSLIARFSYPIYLFYLKNQRDYVLAFDPYTSARLNLFPPFDSERAAIYRASAGPVMRVWRSLFGFGSMMFGLALFIALGHIEYYLVIRLVLLNLLFYAYMRPAQRRASAEAFRRMGIKLPDQRTFEPAGALA